MALHILIHHCLINLETLPEPASNEVSRVRCAAQIQLRYTVHSLKTIGLRSRKSIPSSRSNDWEQIEDF
jgi:hypothetical protein